MTIQKKLKATSSSVFYTQHRIIVVRREDEIMSLEKELGITLVCLTGFSVRWISVPWDYGQPDTSNKITYSKVEL